MVQGIPAQLNIRLRKALLGCTEFSQDDSLRAIFVSVELRPFQDRLPSSRSRAERVDLTLNYLLANRLADGRAVLPLFVEALCDRYHPEDLLHAELADIYHQLSSLTFTESPPSAQDTQYQDSDSLRLNKSPGNVHSFLASPSLGRSSSLESTYQRLHTLLNDKNWQAADLETGAIMLALAGNEAKTRSYLLDSDIDRISSKELQTLDQLWVEASNGRFGLSVQKRVWQAVNGNYGLFGRRVGWNVFKVIREERGFLFMKSTHQQQKVDWLDYDRLSFSLNSPEGHLPMGSRKGAIWRIARGKFGAIASKL